MSKRAAVQPVEDLQQQEQPHMRPSAAPAAPAAALAYAAVAVGGLTPVLTALEWYEQHVHSAHSAVTPQQMRLQTRAQGGGVVVPKSNDRWIVVGIWLASQQLPDITFFLPLVNPETGSRLALPVPYKSIIGALSPKYNGREHIPLHVRVVQRCNDNGRLFGDVRYICTDISASYRMGDNAFKWIFWQ
jgi:hypothetical protein